MNIKRWANELKTDIPAMIIALKLKETPWYCKAIAALVVAYALSPIDLIPDFIPILGLLDDAIILPLLIKVFIKSIPEDVLAKCREQAKISKICVNKKWGFSLPIVLIWALIIFLVAKLIISLI